MDRTEEARLITKAAAGGPTARAAAEALIKAHQVGLYTFILRMSGRVDIAEDVVQEAFIRALTHLDSFDPSFRFSTWLYTIARRVFLNRCDKKQPVLGLACMLEGGAADQSGPSRQDEFVRCRAPEDSGPAARAEHSEELSARRSALESAILKLPLDQREVVLLYHQHGWSVKLIAEETGMPVGTVKSHLHRARARLRALLLPAGEPGVVVTPARRAVGTGLRT